MPDPADPVDPIPPPVSPPVSETAAPTSTGLPSNVAAALACFPLVGGIIFYLLEKRDSFVRFYAMQSIIFGGAWILFWIAWEILFSILRPIPGVGWLFGVLLGLVYAFAAIAFLIVLVIAILKAFNGVRWDIPWVGPMARKQVDRPIV